MFTQEEFVEVSALRKRGWSISAIARHMDASRNTVKAYLRGEQQPGQRRRPAPDPFEPFVEYVSIRLRDDPHLWGSALYDEVRGLGYTQSYVTFVRQLRQRELRPVCSACAGSRSRATIEIEHLPGEEVQWDWLELPAPWGGTATLLQGTLSFSGKTRGVFQEATDQGHLVEAMDGVLRRLGGTARRWRIDRMSTAVHPKTGELLAGFAAVARYYGVAVDVCPAYRAKRKGAVERAQAFTAQRWWRTAQVADLVQAQTAYDRFCAETGDRRRRRAATVAELAAQEHLLPLSPQAYPAMIEVSREVGDSSLVAYRGNRYSVPPGMEGATVTVRQRVGGNELEVLSAAGVQLARHHLLTAGAGAVQRLSEHQAALEKVVLANFATARPCSRKQNRPPSPEAQAAAVRLRGIARPEVVIDLDRYAELTEVGG
jgi:transposase